MKFREEPFKTMFLAFRAAGAMDWGSQLAIALSHAGTHKLQFHHIFPKAVLKGSCTQREADDIANLAFIGGNTNRRISDKPPREYFPGVLEKCGAEAFNSQCIPVDEGLLGVADYKKFLTERRRLVAERLNEFLGCGNAP